MTEHAEATLIHPRRQFFRSAGRATLSATAVAMLAGCASAMDGDKGQKMAMAAKESDIDILNSARGAEFNAIAAYQLGAESGLLQKPVLDLAVKFQGHHKLHADALGRAVNSLGGTPVEPKAKYDFPVENLKSQADVLAFAASLEKDAVSAYLEAVPLFDNSDLAKAAASILGDEAMHWAILRQALGQDPVPVAFMS